LNHEWDIAWSFNYRIDNSIPLLTEDNDILVTENYIPIISQFSNYDTQSQKGFCTFLSKSPNISSFKLGHYMGFFDKDNNLNGSVAIAFDSSGLFALSSIDHPNGVGINDIIPNSLIIRDSTGVIYNQQLPFDIGDNTERIIRFRYINKKEISIDHKTDNNLYETLIRIPINIGSNNNSFYPTFFYTSPISSANSSDSTLYLKNFHVQGNTQIPTFTNL